MLSCTASAQIASVILVALLLFVDNGLPHCSNLSFTFVQADPGTMVLPHNDFLMAHYPVIINSKQR